MLKYRLVSGISLFTLLCLAVFGHSVSIAGVLFSAFSMLLVVLGLREFFTMTGKLGLPGFPKTTMVCGVAYLGVTAVAGYMGRSQGAQQSWPEMAQLAVQFAFFFSCVIATFRSESHAIGIKNLLSSFAGFFYVCWTLALLLRIYFVGCETPTNTWVGPYLMFFVIMVTKCGDIGGYTFGKILSKRKGGNHKLVPKLSPGKSWEGFIGSLTFSVLAAVILVAAKGGTIALQPVNPLLPPILIFGYLHAVGAGLVLATVGLIGDLIESALKRASEVKDSGNVLPGMGGMLDALDSLILIAPLVYVYILFMMK